MLAPMAERMSTPQAEPKPLSPARPEEDSLASKREQIYASRRASAHSGPDSPRTTSSRRSVSSPGVTVDDAPRASVPTKPARKISRPILGAGIVVVLVALVFGAASWLGSIERGTPEGKLKHALLEVDMLTPELSARGPAFAKIEAGDDGPRIALALLEDTSTAQEGSSHSSHTYRELAAEFLLGRSAAAKSAPPAQAVKMAALLRAGQRPSDADWKELREGWATWMSGQAPK
jgi:hypothetical protein